MRVLVTGMINGLDDEKYLQDVLNIGKEEQVDVDYFNLVEEIERTGDKKLDKLLGTTNYLFEVIREREYRKIGFELETRRSENAIIRVPATIEWNRINFKMKDHIEIRDYIKPTYFDHAHCQHIPLVTKISFSNLIVTPCML